MEENILKKDLRSGETSTDMETWQRDYLTGTGWVENPISLSHDLSEIVSHSISLALGELKSDK